MHVDLAERVRRGLPVELTPDEQVTAQEPARALHNGQLHTDAAAGRSLLHPALWHILVRAKEVLARGDAVSLVPTDKLPLDVDSMNLILLPP